MMAEERRREVADCSDFLSLGPEFAVNTGWEKLPYPGGKIDLKSIVRMEIKFIHSTSCN